MTARYGPRVERLGPRLLVVPVTGLEPLADAVRTATVGLGRDDQRPFRGHVTIARTQAHAPSAALGVAIEGEQLVTEEGTERAEIATHGRLRDAHRAGGTRHVLLLQERIKRQQEIEHDGTPKKV